MVVSKRDSRAKHDHSHCFAKHSFDWSELANHLLESMESAEILDSACNLERFDYAARRNYGLAHQPPVEGPFNLHILTNRSAIQIISHESQG